MNKFANIVTSNLNSIVNMIVGFFATKIMLEKLGIDGFAQVSVLLSVTSFVLMLNNAVSSSLAKYVTEDCALLNFESASKYLTTSIFMMVVVGSLFTSLALLLDYLSLIAIANKTDLFLISLSVIIGSIAALLGVAHFVEERFVIRSFINSTSRLIYLAVLYLLLFFLAGPRSVGFALLVSSIYKLVATNNSAIRILPKLTLKIEYVRFDKIRQLLNFMTFTVLSYTGTYFTKSGLLMLHSKEESIDLAILSILLQISNIVFQIYSAFALISSPGIIKSNIIRDSESANTHFIWYVIVASILTGIIALSYVMIGEYLLSLWLGAIMAERVNEFVLLLLFLTYIYSLNMPISVISGSLNMIKVFGVLTLFEGVMVIMMSLLVATMFEFRILYVLTICIFFSTVKMLVMVGILRNWIQFRSVVAFTKKLSMPEWIALCLLPGTVMLSKAISSHQITLLQLVAMLFGIVSLFNLTKKSI